MKPHSISTRYTLLTCLYMGLIGAGPAFITGMALTGVLGASQETIIGRGIAVAALGGLIVSGVFVWRYVKAGRQLAERQVKFAKLADQNGWEMLSTWQPEPLTLSSIHDVADRDQKYRNVYKAPNWQYADMEYAIYQQTRNGEHKVATKYYAVMSAELPRILPNILFDSNKLHGQQFEKIFDPKQRHRLEGGFEKHFTTYFAENYTIDSMSFITPEVMEALIAADDYDIEIAGKWILLYGPLYEPELQMADMSSKMQNIKRHLLDNIDTYRDERLPYEAGRVTVTAQGMRLKRRGISIWVIIGALIYLALAFAGEFME